MFCEESFLGNWSDKPWAKTSLSRQSGQIVVEYVLLLVIGVAIAVLITSMVASRNPDSPGFLVKKWFDIVRTIGQDTADDMMP